MLSEGCGLQVRENVLCVEKRFEIGQIQIVKTIRCKQITLDIWQKILEEVQTMERETEPKKPDYVTIINSYIIISNKI